MHAEASPRRAYRLGHEFTDAREMSLEMHRHHVVFGSAR
jgi:hypothetical protein